jgi:hypothetical protein
MFFGFGGVPSSLMVPVTVPAVAESTGFAAGLAAGAAVSEGFPFPPQLINAAASVTAAAKYHKDLLMTL